MVFQFLTIFILLYTLKEVRTTCHMCQSNFAACHDEKHFTMCTEGILSQIQTCPDGYVCTGETEICSRTSGSNSVQPTCEMACETCSSPDKVFACLDEKTYAFCFGTDVPDYSAKGICPDGYVCNLNQREVCTPASDVYPSCYNGATNAPTTTTSTTISIPTTPSTTSSTNNPQDEAAFCTAKQQAGLHKAENDPTCQKYVLCYILSGQYLGIKYTCSATEYFNDDTKRCQVERPANC